MDNTVFSLTAKDITDLDATRAIGVFRQLLLAETWRLCISHRHVHISSAIDVPDGGIDASVDDLANEKRGNLLYGPTTRYQIKTGNAFKPWQESKLKAELFGSSKKQVTRKNLAPGVAACLNAGGTYAVVCLGVDLADSQRRTSKKFLASLLKTCGFKAPKVEVFGAGEILTYLSLYPSICLDVSRRNDKFLSHSAWSNSEEMTRPFRESSARAEAIGALRESVREQRSVHIRVCGEPGVGKTRLVLEATRQEDLSPAVVYWEKAEDFLGSQQFHDIRSGHTNYAALLVVDECDSENAARIWNVLKIRDPSAPRIRLITIYHDFDDYTRSSDVFYPDISSLEICDIIAILRIYGTPQELARQYGELCSGSPRVAHIVGENLKENAPTLTSPPPTMGDVWTRYIGGRLPRDSDQLRRIKVVLEYIALFKKCGFKPPVSDEADVVFRLINESDSSIGRRVFDEIVRDLRHRRILQGETTVYISPKLFHIWLWCEWWETNSHRPTALEFIEHLPFALFEWFGQMFAYARESRAAMAVVDTLLGPFGPFANPDTTWSDIRGRFFFSLAEASPPEALKALERTVGTWDQNRLREFTAGRREVVASLEKIVYHPELFERAASLLLSLAEFENEHWANNATGVFKKLFSLWPGDFSPTGASPAERFPVLENALNSPSKARRHIGLEACKQALEQFLPPMIIDRKPYGSHTHINSWKPTSQQELIDAIVHVWRLLQRKASESPHEDEKELARTILIDQGAALLTIPSFTDIVIDTFDELAPSSSKALTKKVIQTLRFSQARLSEHATDRVTALRDKLSGSDYSSLLRRYAGIVDWMASIEKGAETQISEKIKDLARLTVESPELLLNELPWATSTEAENSYVFGIEVGRLDPTNALLPAILDAYRGRPDRGFLGLLSGYLKPVYDANRSFWEHTLDLMASDTALAQLVSETTWRTGVTERAGRRILELARRGIIGLEDFNLWNFGVEVVNLPADVLNEWVRYLLEHDASRARLVGLGLFYRYYAGPPNPRPIPLELGTQILLHPDFFNQEHRGTMDEFHWAELASKLIVEQPKFGVTLLEGVLKQWISHQASFGVTPNRAAGVLYKVVQDQPSRAWKVIARLIKDVRSTRSFFIMKWLQGYTGFLADEPLNAFMYIKFSDVADWVDKARESRSRFLASFVPKYLTDPYGTFTHAFAQRYGDDEVVRKNLIANLSSESFSGEASAHYADTRKRMKALKSQELNAHVKRFLDEYIELLDKQIEHWRISEERSSF